MNGYIMTTMKNRTSRKKPSFKTSKNSPFIQTIDPASEEIIKVYSPLTDKALALRLQVSQNFWNKWKKEPFSKKSPLLGRLSSHLLENKKSFAKLITKEMGKPLNQSLAEIEKCALLCRYYQKQGKNFLSPREEFLHYKKSFVQYDPLGGVLGIMPWNFPFWQVFRFAVPALTAGNAVFLKHSENVWGCAFALEKLFLQAGWPKGAFTNLSIERKQVPLVIAHPFIRSVSFTGSTKTGRLIGTLAGKYLKKSILELGGSDPYVVLKDADISKAAESIIQSRFHNSGQSCIAAKRIIVEKEKYNELTNTLKEILKNFTISHPLKNPNIGPLAKKEFVLQLKKLLAKDIKAGAKILYQKKPSPEERKKGFYFPITLLGNCHSKMLSNKEEVFGPLLPVFSVKGEKEALHLAQDTSFGLGAAVFTENPQKGKKWVTEYFEAGSCFLNSLVRSHPALPFGGTGDSGYGREMSREGLKEFTNIKTVVIC